MDFTTLIDRMIGDSSNVAIAKTPVLLMQNMRKMAKNEFGSADVDASELDDLEAEALRSKVRTLYDRLQIGWIRCENERDPRERERLDWFWINLLSQYEAACDQLARMEEPS